MQACDRAGVPLVISLRGSDVPGFSKSRLGPYSVLLPLIVRSVFGRARAIVANGTDVRPLAAALKSVLGSTNPAPAGNRNDASTDAALER